MMLWVAVARSARLLYGGARFPCVPRIPRAERKALPPIGSRSGATAAPRAPLPAYVRGFRPETRFALGALCALGEPFCAAVRAAYARHALLWGREKMPPQEFTVYSPRKQARAVLVTESGRGL